MFQSAGPVKNKRDGLRVAFLNEVVDEEPLPVGGGDKVIPVVRQAGRWNTRGEQSDGGAGLERGARRYGHGHNFFVRGQIEKFPTVTPPLRLIAARRRDLPLTARNREALDVDLGTSRLVRGINHPAPVGGELRVSLVELRDEKRQRLALAEEWQDVKVKSGFRILGLVDDELAARRGRHPVVGEGVVVRTQERFVTAGAA